MRKRRRHVFGFEACTFSVEEIDYRHPRGLVKSKMLELVSCRWVAAHQNVIITGPTETAT